MLNCNFKKNNFIKFLFPLFPLKFYNSIRLIVLFSILISMRLIIQRLSIPVPGFMMSVSISWIINILIGWWFGPIIGIMGGVVTDTMAFFVYNTGAKWFWMYAIQEPIVGFISGIIGSFYLLISEKNNQIFVIKFFKKWIYFKLNKNIISIMLNQFFLISFTAISLVILIFFSDGKFAFANQNKFDKNNFFGYYRYVAISIMILFFLFYEFFSYIFLKSKKNHLSLICFLSTIIIINSLLFSFILGPIISVEYLTYLNGKEPENFLLYGYVFYFIPRVIKETIRLPILISCLLFIVMLITPIFNKFINEAKLKWN